MSSSGSFEAPRQWSRGIPVTGAWLQGDPVGDRQFHSLTAQRPFVLEGGGVLTDAEIALMETAIGPLAYGSGSLHFAGVC